MIRFTHAAMMASLGLLSACAAPNIAAELAVFSTTMDEVSKPLLPSLEKTAQAERKLARDTAIRLGQPVYRSPKACIDLVALNLDQAAPSKCALDPLFKTPVQKGSATFALAAWSVIRSYEATLNALASNTSASEIGENLGKLLQEGDKLKQSLAEDTSVEAISASDIKLVSSLAKGLSEAARARAIRKLVIDAHDPLKTIIGELIALRQSDRALRTQRDALTKAHSDMQTARAAVSLAPASPTAQRAYGEEVDDYEDALKAFKAAFAASDVANLVKLWKSQEALLAAVKGDQDPESLLTILEDIKALSE